MASGTAIDRERERVREIRDDLSGWRRWGPYVSDRSWGTVREDYSADGNAWRYLTYDKARAKAYRWGEDGIAGLCDRYQLLCFAPAFWNERDPHLKERLFGVNPYEGNHGEDVKEYYFHVDNTPTHSYMCLLYKYPQAAFPYRELDRAQPAPRRTGSGVRAARYRGIRGRSLLRHLHRVRQGRSGGHRDPDHRAQPRARRRAAAHPADLVVPQHVGLGTDAAARAEDHVRARGRRVPGGRRQRHVRRSQHAGALPARTALPVRTGRRRPCSPTTRPTASAPTDPATPAASRTPRTRSTARSASATRRRSDPTAAAPRRRCTTSTWCRRAARSRCACGSPTRRRPDALADRRHDHRRAQGRGRHVLRRSGPARGHRRRAARAAPRAGGAPVDASRATCSTWRAGSTAMIPRSRRRRRGARSATATGAT